MTMSTPTCPVCGAPVDPARAPVARVRASRILTYCSVACADGDRDGASSAAAREPRDDAPEVAPRKRRVRLLGAVLAAIGAALAIAGALVSAGLLLDDEVEPAAAASAIAEEPAADEREGGDADEDDVRARIEAVLRDEMETGVPSLAWRAAAALSRVGDERAIAMLRERLDREAETLIRLEVAAALARAGDAAGGEVLEELARADDEDVATAAATALAALEGEREARAGGSALDEGAVAELEAAFTSPKRRVRAAESLAALGAQVEREPLVRALVTERGAARIAAAEALLILETSD